jgi:hypothetical protein
MDERATQALLSIANSLIKIADELHKIRIKPR